MAKSISARYDDALKELRDSKAAFDKTKNTKTGLHTPASAERYAEAINRVKRLRALGEAEAVDEFLMAV